MLSIWLAEIKSSNGSVGVSQILRKELEKIAEDKEGGYYQSCKVVFARKAGGRTTEKVDS